MTADLERFETQAVPPQLVAQEVGRLVGWGRLAAGTAHGLQGLVTSDLRQCIRVITTQPLRLQVGMAAAITCAVGVLHTTVRALPVKSGLLIRGESRGMCLGRPGQQQRVWLCWRCSTASGIG